MTDAAFRWLQPDAHHIRTACGRYTVARDDLGDRDDYIAWRAGFPPVELACQRVPKTSPDELRLAAIKAMQKSCADDAAAIAAPASEKAA